MREDSTRKIKKVKVSVRNQIHSLHPHKMICTNNYKCIKLNKFGPTHKSFQRKDALRDLNVEGFATYVVLITLDDLLQEN